MKKRILRVLLVLAMFLSLTGCGGQENTQGGHICTLEIRCDSLLSRLDELEPGKAALVPEDGVLLTEREVTFSDGETVFDVFRRTLRNEKLHFEYVDATAYSSVYIEGIGNLYEFDCGPQSGWKYSVNGVCPGLSCSGYTLAQGDRIVFFYTCDLSEDVGTSYEE